VAIIDSTELVLRKVRASVGGTPSRAIVSVSGRPPPQAGGSAGIGAVQFAGEGDAADLKLLFA
jgi:hypothetical protein